MPAPTRTLAHGATIPRLGLGTAPMTDAEAEASVASAIASGYRLVDTAENYGNEVGVGRGLRAGGVDRSELFVTTKFNKAWHSVAGAEQAWGASAERLGVDYIDLLLIHWPNPAQDRYVEAWQGLVGLLEVGKVRAIGTSNFKPAHLERIIEATGVTPDLNQIQLNPSVTRDAAVAYHEAHGIVTESWAPIGGEGVDLLSDPVVTEMAGRYGRTPAQVVLRWHMERGFVTVPKSTHAERIAQNIDIFDFGLEPADIDALSGLDRGEKAAFDSDRFGH